MGRTTCTEPKCLYKGALYLTLRAHRSIGTVSKNRQSVRILHKVLRLSVYVRQYGLLEGLEKADQQCVYFPMRPHLAAILASSRWLLLCFKVIEITRAILSRVTYFQARFLLCLGLNNILKHDSWLIHLKLDKTPFLRQNVFRKDGVRRCKKNVIT